MLEKDFTKLDNDFITIWSKYLVCKDINSVFPELTALAELGQVNAIQKWCLLAIDEQNDIIDTNIQQLGESFEDDLARASYYRNKHYDEITTKLTQLKSARMDYESVKNFNDANTILDAKTKLDEADHTLMTTEWYQNMKSAVTKLLEVQKSSRKILYAERYIEIMKNMNYFGTDTIFSTYRIDEKEVFNKLRLKFNKNNDVATKFAFGKNLIRRHKGEINSYESGKMLLESLSKRELSSTLINYMNSIETNKQL